MTKAVFLDRDGTINVEKNYLHRIEDFEFLPGVFEALQLLQSEGYLLIVITNQSGIGRGYYTVEEFNKLNDWMLDQLQMNGVRITDVFFCPHNVNSTDARYQISCHCRKPEIGLYESAVQKYHINLERSWSVGDRIRDCAISSKSKCRSILIGRNERAEEIDKVKSGMVQNVSYADHLLDAAKRITGFIE
ncbi:HAD family hydrolase [bacterium 1xD42-87]|jgi:D-glycero-D-manno-heptose 1,7-bisphosphate phosphatase|nr:HAD family hydrolase [bacterium 1xD42-87]